MSTSLTSDTNAVATIAKNGDLVRLTSAALGYQFNGAKAGTLSGSDHPVTFVYNQNQPPNPTQTNLKYTIWGAGGATNVLICLGANAADPGASVASTTGFSSQTINSPVYNDSGSWSTI